MFNRLQRVLDRVHPLVWAAGVILLPITSMPLIAKIIGSDMVAAPSALPFAWLFIVWFIPFLLHDGRLSKLTVPILVFVVVAAISSAAAFFLEIPLFKDISVLKNTLQAIITLGVGLVFYFVTATWIDSRDRLQKTYQYLNLAGLLIILYSAVQAYSYKHFNLAYPDALLAFQKLISVSGNLFDNRVSGFAYEPSWLAHQLNMLWLPYWFSATIQRFSAYRLRLFGITAENCLLAGGLATLFYSSSRVGLLACLVVVAYLMLLLTLWFGRRLHAWLNAHIHVQAAWKSVLSRAVSVGILVAFVTVYVAGAYGVVVVAAKHDYRLAKIFEKPEETIFSFQYANQLAFAERAVFWAAGWSIFNDHPWIGVGLGNAGYYFEDALPTFSWALPEVRTLMFRNTYLPNTKSLWTRLLAETGLVGFAIFFVWLWLIWQSGQTLRRSSARIERTAGMAGVLTIVALLIEGFSVDSFALPYLWISMGIVTAAIQIFRRFSLAEQNQVLSNISVVMKE